MTERRGRTPNREGHSRWTLLRLCGDDDNNFIPLRYQPDIRVDLAGI